MYQRDPVFCCSASRFSAPLSGMNFKIEWHEQLASTNRYIKERFAAGAPLADGFVAAARDQTAGRGRFERPWKSSPNTNLCCSVYLEAATRIEQIPALTMAAALAVTDYLRSNTIFARPKWPNDVFAGGRKICGILAERVECHASQRGGLVVGIGLNVNMSTSDAAEINQPATSMLIETGRTFALEKTLEQLCMPLGGWVEAGREGGFEGLRGSWEQQTGLIGRLLTVRDGEQRKTGILAGYGPHGEILLSTPGGTESIWSGEIPL